MIGSIGCPMPTYYLACVAPTSRTKMTTLGIEQWFSITDSSCTSGVSILKKPFKARFRTLRAKVPASEPHPAPLLCIPKPSATHPKLWKFYAVGAWHCMNAGTHIS
jgi:hypothetical protein